MNDTDEAPARTWAGGVIRARMMDGSTGEPGFRWRGREVSRLEALSDAVFGFAITLLVVSLEVPRTATALFEAMSGLLVFAFCFALLFLVWFNQYRFFRRYGLDDTTTILLNAVLLFVIVFFVYPLRFVFAIVVDMVLGGRPWRETIDGVPVLSLSQRPMLMTVFGAGYLAVFLLFALMHLHAYRLRDVLDLSPEERYATLDHHPHLRDRAEDVRDRREDRRDRREDVRDRREDRRDARHIGGVRDLREDVRDRREDVRDRREDVRDRREDVRDRRRGV